MYIKTQYFCVRNYTVPYINTITPLEFQNPYVNSIKLIFDLGNSFLVMHDGNAVSSYAAVSEVLTAMLLQTEAF